MSAKSLQDDPLIEAIARLRVEVDRLIDLEANRLQAFRESGGEVGRTGAVSLAPAIVLGLRDAAGEASGPRPIDPVPRATREVDQDDPKKRLDALAQRLEGRVRYAADRKTVLKPDDTPSPQV